jgi:hypothetical protein
VCFCFNNLLYTWKSQARFTSIILDSGRGFVKPEGIVFDELYIEEKSRDLFVRKAERMQHRPAASSSGTEAPTTTTAATNDASRSSGSTAAAAAAAAAPTSDTTRSGASTNDNIEQPNSIDSTTAAAEDLALQLDSLHFGESSNSSERSSYSSESTEAAAATTLQPRRVKLGYSVVYSNAGTDRALGNDAAVALLLQCRSQLEAELGITYL